MSSFYQRVSNTTQSQGGEVLNHPLALRINVSRSRSFDSARTCDTIKNETEGDGGVEGNK